MGFRIEGLGSDDFFNNLGLVGTEVKIANQYLRNNNSSNRQENSVNREDKVGVEIDGYNSKTEASSDKKSSNKLKTEEPKSEDSKIEGITVTTDMPDSIPTPPKNGVSKTSLDGAVSYTKVVVDGTVDNPEGPTYQEIIKYDDGTIIVNTYQGDKLSMSIERNFEDEEGNPIYKGDIGWQERYREYIKSVNEFGLAQEIRKQSLIDY